MWLRRKSLEGVRYRATRKGVEKNINRERGLPTLYFLASLTDV